MGRPNFFSRSKISTQIQNFQIRFRSGYQVGSVFASPSPASPREISHNEKQNCRGWWQINQMSERDLASFVSSSSPTTAPPQCEKPTFVCRQWFREEKRCGFRLFENWGEEWGRERGGEGESMKGKWERKEMGGREYRERREWRIREGRDTWSEGWFVRVKWSERGCDCAKKDQWLIREW